MPLTSVFKIVRKMRNKVEVHEIEKKKLRFLFIPGLQLI
jgi:hypothetical protein